MGSLSLVATPIGNIEDITIRAIKTLISVDAILCEDTRKSGILIAEIIRKYGEVFDCNYDWKPTLISYYEENEYKKLPEIIHLLQEGKHLALISDSGTPLISDPGYFLVSECIKRKIPVESIPGPSAFISALTISGFPVDKFFFLGYPPDKESSRRILFKKVHSIHTYMHSTFIFYCAPHKLIRTLHDLKSECGNTSLGIMRELTKVHEECWIGTINDAIQKFTHPKGEFVLVVRFKDT